MTRRFVDYEWTAEELLDDGDINDVHFADTIEGIFPLFKAIEGEKRIGVLRRVVITECDNEHWRNDPTTEEESRDYAYFDERGFLPEFCAFGARLPLKIRNVKIDPR